MTTVYLIRHAEAEGNYYRRIQGHWDGGITAKGFKQIDALAERMKDVHLDALYSSDLTRTMLTAGAITKYHDLPLVTDKRLREVYMGVWEGVGWGDADWYDHEQYTYFSSNPDLWQVEGSESWHDLQERLYSTVADLASRHEGQTIAIVSHGTALRALMCKIFNVAGKDIHTVKHGDNTAVSLLTVENGVLSVEYASDNSHLGEDLTNHARQTWWKTGRDQGNLHYRPLDLATEAKFYLQCYADSWKAAHGDTEGFVPALYLMSAKRWLDDCPEAIAVGLDEDQVAGLIALDTHRGAEEKQGWVGFLYAMPDKRGHRYGAQLLGYAMMLYTKLGRDCLRLSVSEDNIAARGFYEHLGFVQVDEAVGIGAPLLILEKKLGRGVLPL